MNTNPSKRSLLGWCVTCLPLHMYEHITSPQRPSPSPIPSFHTRLHAWATVFSLDHHNTPCTAKIGTHTPILMTRYTPVLSPTVMHPPTQATTTNFTTPPQHGTRWTHLNKRTAVSMSCISCTVHTTLTTSCLSQNTQGTDSNNHPTPLAAGPGRGCLWVSWLIVHKGFSTRLPNTPRCT